MPSMVSKGLSYLRERGLKEFASRALEKAADAGYDYNRAASSGKLTPLEAGYQKTVRFRQMPSVFVMVLREEEAIKNTEEYARTLHSIRRQTYARTQTLDVLNTQVKEDDLVAFAREGDILPEQAVFGIVKASGSGALCLYTDEDSYRTCKAGGKETAVYEKPLFKPDFDPDYLRSMNYIGRLFAVRAKVLRLAMKGEEISAWKLYDLAAYYRMVLACTRLAGQMAAGDLSGHSPRQRSYGDPTLRDASRRAIVHVPRVLCHAYREPEKDEEALRKVLREDLSLRKERGVVEYGPAPGTYHIYYLPEDEPLVSVVIPNRDHADLLRECIGSLEQFASWENLEIIIAENSSGEKETFEYYRSLESGEGHRFPVKIARYPHEGFNFSAIINEGVRAARGDFLLLLNNDVTVKTPDFAERLLGQCRREGVGAAGPKLLYPDGTVQSAGIVAGIMGFAGSMMVGEPGDAPGYMNRASVTQRMSAVTAACMMVTRRAYAEAKGFDPAFQVALNDVDFCLRLGISGWKVIYEPSAVMVHHESRSRGYETSREKKQRFAAEQKLFRKRYRRLLKEGDPCYSPSLSLRKCDYSPSSMPGIL